MSLGKGIAIAGIWSVVGLIAWQGIDGVTVAAAIPGMLATVLVVMPDYN